MKLLLQDGFPLPTRRDQGEENLLLPEVESVQLNGTVLLVKFKNAAMYTYAKKATGWDQLDDGRTLRAVGVTTIRAGGYEYFNWTIAE